MSPVTQIDDAVDLTVEVMSVRYRSPETDFTVLQALTEEGDEFVLTGALSHLHEGETVSLRGHWREHPKHGRQFHALQALTREPTSELALLGYLSQIKHVGPRGAAFLLDRFGSDVLQIIDREPHRSLLTVPGIGRARISAAVDSWEEQGAQREVRIFLAMHGVSASVAARIYRAWGSDSIERLRKDPYTLTELVGIGFATADALAKAMGIPLDAPSRLDAGLLHSLRRAELGGHCYLPRRQLCAEASRLLGRSAESRIKSLAKRGAIVIERQEGEQLIYETGLHRVESSLARCVREMIAAKPTLKLKRVRRPTRGGFLPTDDQWHALQVALKNRLSILTGGPGTGKTMSMRAIVELLRSEDRTVRLCAPTGKAARRLSAATGQPASTIHRLLEWMPGEGFARDADTPIEGADMLIVDEASMLSVRLAQALMCAVGPHTHVLLVGDVDQLAPVGSGRVLEDLIACEQVPVTCLNEIFRQAARSLIVLAAHAINRGEPPPTSHDPDTIRDFFFIRVEEQQAIFDEVISLASERLASHYGFDPKIEIQVLAPMRRGPVGIDAINAELRARLNPRGKPIADSGLRVGDRVIQTRNDHEHELMNGEVGVIEEHNPDSERVRLATDDGRELTLPVAALETVQLAYAISIHKSQGSQAPAIVVPLARSHGIMLTRNLLYTAVTRSEQVCVVVGEPAALELALSRRDARARYTRLSELVLSTGVSSVAPKHR
ncbi:MAG TPA: ATP-dependent RecD-like DNA helicase [Solirubrobacteraceae bacterium]|jgi:exodeoxyribonuclease V alpha subunit